MGKLKNKTKTVLIDWINNLIITLIRSRNVNTAQLVASTHPRKSKFIFTWLNIEKQKITLLCLGTLFYLFHFHGKIESAWVTKVVHFRALFKMCIYRAPPKQKAVAQWFSPGLRRKSPSSVPHSWMFIVHILIFWAHRTGTAASWRLERTSPN